jgi:hypothetical protein
MCAPETTDVDGVARGLQSVADDRVVDLFGRNARRFQCAARRRRSEVDGLHVLERADVPCHRRALAAEDEDVFRHNLS